MNYSQHLSSALVAFGSGDEAGAFAEIELALAEAGKVDPEGPRVAEVLNYAAQMHSQAGRPQQARQALERVAAIWEKLPEFAAGLEDYYLQLMGLCTELGDLAAAEAWKEKAREAAASRADKPWR